jgi:hypothetical protein
MMRSGRQILGYVVRELRERVTAGVPPREVLSYIAGRTGDNERLAYTYLAEAFLQGNTFFFLLGPGPVDPTSTREVIDQLPDIFNEHKERWLPYPELRRVRDYLSFLEFARDEHVVVTVCGWRAGDEGYRLHGVYDVDSLEPVWSAKRGDKLRAAINRRLGDELVRFGPHDDWEHRNDRAMAGGLWGPQVPVMEFDAGGNVDNHLDVVSLATSEPYRRRWERLYPHHPVTP